MKKKYKTKFPVARIKKIMQMDEDVGKVAQATPVLISKALELFMQSLIDQACQETRSRDAKRITVAHLKKTIMKTEQFDFLKDVVINIPDPVEPHEGENSSNANKSDPNSKGDDANNPQPKKRRRRRKNADADEAATAAAEGSAAAEGDNNEGSSKAAASSSAPKTRRRRRRKEVEADGDD